MTTLAFVIWMIGWPASCGWLAVYAKKCGEKYSENVREIGDSINFIIWVIIGIMLWLNR